MVTIPGIYTQQVREADIGHSKMTVRANGQQFGSGVAQATANFGGSLTDVAEAMDFKDQITAKADSDVAYTDYMNARRDIMRDPETGYLNQTGGNAVGGRDALSDRLSQARSDVEGGLSPRAARAFADRADALDQQSYEQAINHESVQLRNYSNDAADAAIEASLREASLNYDDDKASDAMLGEAITEVRNKAALNGTPPQEVDNLIANLTSATTKQRAINMAYDDPIAADKFLDEHEDRMTTEEYRATKTALKPIVVQSKARSFVDGGLARIGKAAMPGSEESIANANKLMSTGMTALGLNEKQQRSALMEYMADGGVNMDPATTAWCAGYVNGTLGKAGFKGTGSLAARSFLKWGVEVTGKPEYGDIMVFSRGDDENAGHVGFFGGYDESGNMLILGGNQNDTVSITARNGSKLIGVRRAPSQDGNTMASSGSTADVFQDIMDIEDPDVREASLTLFKQRMQMSDYMKGKEVEAAGDDAWQSIVEGGDPSDLPPEQQILLGPAGMSSLIGAARTYKLGTDTTDEIRYNELYDTAFSEDPAKRQEFMDYDLNGEMDNLSQGALQYFKDQQTEMRSGRVKAGPGASDTVYDIEDYSKVYTASKTQYEAAVGKSADDPKAWNRFTSQLRQAMDAYATEKGKQMPPSLIDQTIGMLLTPVIINPKGIYNEHEGFMMDVPFRPAGADVDVNMSYEDIEYNERARVDNFLSTAYGRPPTDSEIVDHYEREQLQKMGLRPEIEFGDIPKDLRKDLAKKHPGKSEEQLIDLYLSVMIGRTSSGGD